LEALWTENFNIFHDHLVYFVAICFRTWQFGTCLVNSLKDSHFGILCHEKSGNPEFLFLFHFIFQF
jgi:hypothetical protein